MQLNKTTRFIVPLRHEHPQEAAVITELMAFPMRRRADRVRELLTRGGFREVPPVFYTSGHARNNVLLPPVRLGIYLYPAASSDAAVLADVELVHPKLVSEFLRDRLIAGLLGQLQTLDIEIDTFVTAAPTATTASAAPSQKPIAAVTTSPKSNDIVDPAPTQPNQPRDTASAVPSTPPTAAVKRPELLKLFQ